MTSRSADATIKGYYYQFDTSILKLLELKNDTESITIEGIEDIDINTATDKTTVQCKYLSKSRYNNSTVRDPIILMLEHFIDTSTPNDLNYVLYAHFENETLGNEPTIDISRLKEILTYTDEKIKKHYEIEKKISDSTLNTFISQFKLIFGIEFITQQKQVIGKLKDKFTCSEFEADTLYYNNALRKVLDKAIEKNIKNRTLTKGEFIKAIDCKKQLFNEWYIKLRSKKEYLKLIADNLNSTKALIPIKEKILLIGKEILNSKNVELPFIAFIENLIDKYYKYYKALSDAKPLIFIIDCDKKNLLSYKKELLKKEILFNDGYEEIDFSINLFNRNPIIYLTKTKKISNSSFLIKLISKETFNKNISLIRQPDVFINFSNENIDNPYISAQFFENKYCDNLKEIFQIIK